MITMLVYVVLYLMAGILLAMPAVKDDPSLGNSERLFILLFWPVVLVLFSIYVVWKVITTGLLWVVKKVAGK